LIEVSIAGNTPALEPSFRHQIVESEDGGQEKVLDGLKELIITTSSGI
jgi:hypothetical protein